MVYELASSSWGKEEVDAMQRVIASNSFTMGKEVNHFESDFASKFGSRYAVMVNSGSSANLLAVAALFYKKENPLKAGDEVIVPAVAWSTTYYPLLQYGLRPIFLDVELETLNMDISQLEKAITPKTRAIMAVNALGNPCDLEVIQACCKKHNLYLIEDNCESMGASINGKQCGTFGDIGTFSTFFSHHISTMEGGVCVTENKELADLLISLRAHGWTRHLPEDTQIFQKNDDPFLESYRFILPGYNVRPGELNGATGIEQLKKLDYLIQMRRQNASLWQSLFSEDERFIIQQENGYSSWFAFSMILNPEYNIKRQRITKALSDADIQSRLIVGGNFLRQDVIKYFDYTAVGDMKNANIAHDHGFYVGNAGVDLSKEIKQFYEVLMGVVK